MDESGDHVVSYREFFSFVKHKVDAFMGGDHAIVTELGKEQLQMAGDGNLTVPPGLVRATSDSAQKLGRPPSMKREISRKPDLTQGLAGTWFWLERAPKIG